MSVEGEFAVRLVFDKHADGRYHIYSPNVPGLHLAGTDLDALRRDIEPVVKDLLLHNKKLVVEKVRWVPPLESVVLAEIEPYL